MKKNGVKSHNESSESLNKTNRNSTEQAMLIKNEFDGEKKDRPMRKGCVVVAELVKAEERWEGEEVDGDGNEDEDDCCWDKEMRPLGRKPEKWGPDTFSIT